MHLWLARSRLSREIGRSSTPTYGATAWIAPNWPIPAGTSGSRTTATRVTVGAICLRNSSHLPPMLYSNEEKPVALPLGRPIPLADQSERVRNNADSSRSESPSTRREVAPLYAHGPRNPGRSRWSWRGAVHLHPAACARRNLRCQIRSAGRSSRVTRSTRPSVLDSRSSIPRCNTMKQTANASVDTLAQLAFIG